MTDQLQLDRIEMRLAAINDRQIEIATAVATLKGRMEAEAEAGKSGGGHSSIWLERLIAAAIAAVFGYAGSHGGNIPGAPH